MKKTIIALTIFANILLGQSQNHDCSISKIKHFERLQKSAKVNYPGDQNIDVTYYKLDLYISYPNRSISGEVTIKAKSLANNLNNVFFDLQDHFTLNDVSSNGTSLSASLQNNKVNVTLDKSYNQNEEFTIKINYNGTPGSSGFGSFEFNEHVDEGNIRHAIWTLSEPYGSSDWWPSKDTPADKADSSDVWVTADDFFVTVSNGVLEAEINNGDGTKTYKWHNSYPIAHYLISLAMTNYEVYQNDFEYEPGKFLPVVHYNYPENFDANRKRELDATNKMLEVFSNLFGEYPFINEKYGHAEFGWGGAMEHQTVSSMGGYWESIVAHELAHQWFGDKITCADWQNIWLNEGFATYSEALFVEAKYGKDAYHDYINDEIGTADQNWTAKGAIGSIFVRDISSVGEIFSGARSYAKGSVVLHMLRKVMGDENFFSALKQYINHPDLVYDVATIDDFKDVCEDVSGIDLDYFFSQWLYGENYPKYSVIWNSTNLGNENYSVNLNVEQSQNKNPIFFTMPIDIKITTSSGDTTITIFNNSISQNFIIDVIGQPTNLEFDPENWIMKDFSIITDINIEDNNIPTCFTLEQNYPNPFNPITTISYQIPNVASDFSLRDVKLKVYNILGKFVATLVNKQHSAGNYSVEFNASNIPSGIYYYQLTSGSFSETKKMILLK